MRARGGYPANECHSSRVKAFEKHSIICAYCDFLVSSVSSSTIATTM